MHVCVVHICMFTCVAVHTYARACGGSPKFFGHSASSILRQGHSLDSELAVSDSLTRQLAPGGPCLCLPGAEIKGSCHTLGILTLVLRLAQQALN